MKSFLMIEIRGDTTGKMELRIIDRVIQRGLERTQRKRTLILVVLADTFRGTDTMGTVVRC